MLDLILYLIGATLFVGQAVYFLAFSENWIVPGPSAGATYPAAGPDWAGTYAWSETGDWSETGARQH